MSSTEHHRPMADTAVNTMSWTLTYNHYAALTSHAYQHHPSSHPKDCLPSTAMDHHLLPQRPGLVTWRFSVNEGRG